MIRSTTSQKKEVVEAEIKEELKQQFLRKSSSIKKGIKVVQQHKANEAVMNFFKKRLVQISGNEFQKQQTIKKLSTLLGKRMDSIGSDS
jgi:hypothetical protein